MQAHGSRSVPRRHPRRHTCAAQAVGAGAAAQERARAAAPLSNPPPQDPPQPHSTSLTLPPDHNHHPGPYPNHHRPDPSPTCTLAPIIPPGPTLLTRPRLIHPHTTCSFVNPPSDPTTPTQASSSPHQGPPSWPDHYHQPTADQDSQWQSDKSITPLRPTFLTRSWRPASSWGSCQSASRCRFFEPGAAVSSLSDSCK